MDLKRLWNLLLMVWISGGACLFSQVSADTIDYTTSYNNGDTVFNPGDTGAGYWEVATLLDDVFGTADPGAGAFTETYSDVFTVGGEGNQMVDFTFLYDDGGYEFQFGYFVVTDALLDLPTGTVAEKEYWAYQALSSAEVLFVDREYNDSYSYWDPEHEWIEHGRWSEENGGQWVNGECIGCTWVVDGGYWQGADVTVPGPGAPAGAQVAIPDPGGNVIPGQESFTYSGVRTTGNTVTREFEGGTRLGFFIIPDNTLENFLSDYSDNTQFDSFGVNRSGDADGWVNGNPNWPLFSITDANPGLESGNTGNNGETGAPDQVMTFEGTTRDGWLTDADTGDSLAGQNGTFVAFEDLWRRPEKDPDNWWLSSDEDFSDLVFHVGNVRSGNAVPEPTSVVAGIGMCLAIGLHFLRKRKQRNPDLD